MIFSKSFGYAIRGVLYVASKPEGSVVQLEEIASALDAPRHFMGKIMKRVVQQDILLSQKGPTGGFKLNTTTLKRPLIDVYMVTDHLEDLHRCVLSKQPCSSENPCGLHDLILPSKTPLFKILYDTTVGELLVKTDNFKLPEALMA